MLFKSVIGQHKIKQQLITTTTSGHISHAQMFLGPDGYGGLALAIAYAQFINCTNKHENDACGVCASCLKFNKLIHPDLHFVFPVVKTSSKNVVSDDLINKWREFILQNPYFTAAEWYNYIGVENKQGSIHADESNEIIKKLNLKTFESEYKIMIIWKPEAMNITAANKLLKILEEPPEKTIFLLIAESTDRLLSTIISRTQILKLPKCDDVSLQEKLKEQGIEDVQQLKDLSHLANGNYINALHAIDQKEQDEYNLEQFKQLMRLAYSKNIIDLINWVEQIATIGREKQKSFLMYGSRLLRENWVMNLKKTELVYLTAPETAFSEKFSPFITSKNIPYISKEFDLAAYHIGANAYNKIVFMDLALKLIRIFRNKT